MTAFNKADLPDDVDSVEKLLLWSASVLVLNYANKTAEESRDNPVREVAITPFFNDSSLIEEQWHWRTIVRISQPISSNWLKGGQLYTFAEPLGALAIPSELKPPSENLP